MRAFAAFCTAPHPRVLGKLPSPGECGFDPASAVYADRRPGGGGPVCGMLLLRVWAGRGSGSVDRVRCFVLPPGGPVVTFRLVKGTGAYRAVTRCPLGSILVVGVSDSAPYARWARVMGEGPAAQAR